MSNDVIVGHFRKFLLGLSAFMLVGTLGELIAIGHYVKAIQFLPFLLAGIGLASAIVAFFWPTRGVLQTVRVFMVLMVLGSGIGVWQHVQANIHRMLPTLDGASLGQIIDAGLRGGNPLLAPGMLAIAGILSAASTYYHPLMADAKARVAVRSGAPIN